MSRIWMPGGVGGADLDVVTAGAGDVLKGKVIVGPDGEPLTGTLALSGDAGDSMVLAGKIYYSTDPKQKRTGTMANQGAKTAALNCGGSYTIPAGYHNGQGKVTANSLAAQTGVQSGKSAAGAGQVLTGYEAWVNGGRVTGTMANQGTKTAALNCGGSYTIPAGYHNGQGKVTANSLAAQTDSNAGAGDILSGKTAWVKGSKITGTLGTMAGQTITPTISQQTVSCSGKKMTGNVVVNAIPSNYEQPSSDRKTANNVSAAGSKDFFSKTNKACQKPYIRISKPTSFPVRAVMIFSWTSETAATFFQLDADDNAWFMDGNTWQGHENACYQISKINLGAATYELPICATSRVSYICIFKS